ncbi:MAG: hypothetical protein L0Y38_00645 [Methylococcaceae bacterium]|nr:hypothetical protein [Methylococcaceae bacterium]
MNRNVRATLISRLGLYPGLLLIVLCAKAAAHGGVMIEEDRCIIKFGFYKAHFTVYQPLTSRDQEFCEDLPDPGPTVFVLGYLHESLRQVPVDFRIIRDITGLGRFAKWSDLEQIENLENHSVFYQAPLLRPEGVLMVEHAFDESGDYIGIVTARHPSNDNIYRAVFPFRVGSHRFFYAIVALMLIGLALAQYRFRVFNILIEGIRNGSKRFSDP